ncbi:uncharacterized protein LOC121050751 [Rosa chinensis]|uniref:uncharacterized protein LOC121050751 n=1 Tax=Rosa chinensis TaxID=74649 RepID=UPI001AD9421A|nr:uncharacterized protein LOC121050751 [Rosa chinensis]
MAGDVQSGRGRAETATSAGEDTVASQRREERLASHGVASGSHEEGGNPADESAAVSTWKLSDGMPVDEAGDPMSQAAINRMKRVFKLPGVAKLRALLRNEPASSLPAGYAAVHEAVLRQGVRFPLLPNLQILLCEFDLAFGQICPNMWKLLIGLNGLWRMSGCEGSTVAEVLHFYELVYVKRKGCSGQVNLSRRTGAPRLVENPPDSMSPWRATCYFTTEGWEYDATLNKERPTHRIKSKFQPIRARLHFVLMPEEECRVARITDCWKNRNLIYGY